MYDTEMTEHQKNLGTTHDNPIVIKSLSEQMIEDLALSSSSSSSSINSNQDIEDMKSIKSILKYDGISQHVYNQIPLIPYSDSESDISDTEINQLIPPDPRHDPIVLEDVKIKEQTLQMQNYTKEQLDDLISQKIKEINTLMSKFE